MTKYVYIDGKYIEKDKASLPIMTHAFLYGTSVFEGIRAYYNKNNDQLYIFRAKEHFERLVNSAKLLHMDTKYTIDEFCATTKELLKKKWLQTRYIHKTHSI